MQRKKSRGGKEDREKRGQKAGRVKRSKSASSQNPMRGNKEREQYQGE
jgi:hypothetical protein